MMADHRTGRIYMHVRVMVRTHHITLHMKGIGRELAEAVHIKKTPVKGVIH